VIVYDVGKLKEALKNISTASEIKVGSGTSVKALKGYLEELLKYD
jgi:hypothetical protein